MEDQTKILIGVFSGLTGVVVVIGLSILGWRKKEKTTKDEVWNKWQKDTLFKGKVLEVKEQVDELKASIDETSEIVSKLVIKDAERDALEAEEAEETERLKDERNKAELEMLQEMYNKSVLPQVAEIKKEHAEIRQGLNEVNNALEAYDKLVTQGVKDLQGAGEGFKALRRMKKEDKEIEDETDPDVRDAMVSAQLEELRELRGKLVGNSDDDELNKPGSFLIPNTHGQEI